MNCKIIYNTQGIPTGVQEMNSTKPSKEFQEILNNPQVKNFDEALQIYKNMYAEELGLKARVADQLPLTLQVFQRPEFIALQGKQVNPITVLNSLNQAGIKQIERDLIKQVIENNYKGQKKVDESRGNKKIDFNNRKSIKQWIENNAPDSLFDDEGELDTDFVNKDGDNIEDLIDWYTSKYNEVKNEGSATLYRAVRLDSINQLDKNNIGEFWSFEKDGASNYGAGGKRDVKEGDLFLIEANVNFEDINWEEGFYSFLAYGREEFEAYLYFDAKVDIEVFDKNDSRVLETNGIIYKDRLKNKDNKISYDELEATVRANIMPLERIFTSSYANYGMDNLGDGNYGEANTLILNAPIEHGVTGHFSGDFKASGRKNIKYQAKQLNDNTWVAVEEGYESQANDNNIYEFVGTAGTKEAVDVWIEGYNNPERVFNTKNTKIVRDTMNGEETVILLDSKNSPMFTFKMDEFESEDNLHKQVLDKYNGIYAYPEVINKGMFGHIRVWQDGEVFTVAELQSDYFQKNNAKRDLVQVDTESVEYKEDRKKIYDKEVDYTKILIAKAEDKNAEDISNIDLGYAINRIYREEAKEKFKKDYENLNKKYENKLSPQEKQFIASQKIWEQRMVREAIKEASLS